MHSSRMRTASSLTVSHSICHACLNTTHVPPVMHASLPCTPPLATHTPMPHTCPPAMHTPLPCTPPAMHALLPCMPPAMHIPMPHTHPLPCIPPCHASAPCHAHPLPCMPPCHACPPPVDRILDTLLKILLCPNFVAGGNEQIN